MTVRVILIKLVSSGGSNSLLMIELCPLVFMKDERDVQNDMLFTGEKNDWMRGKTINLQGETNGQPFKASNEVPLTEHR